MVKAIQLEYFFEILFLVEVTRNIEGGVPCGFALWLLFNWPSFASH
jgi:hypothetical protein